MSRQPLIYDLVHVRYQNPERSYAVDAPAVVEYVFPDGCYEVLFLDEGAGCFDRQYLRPISLNDLTPSQVLAARHRKDELLERFQRTVATGHLVRDVDGQLLVLGDMVANRTFQAVDLNTHKETIVAEQDCIRVTPFDLPFAERLEFEALSQWQNQLAAHKAVPGDLHLKLCESLDERYADDELTRERIYGVMCHWLYLRFPEYAAREFAGREETARQWLVEDDPSGLTELVEVVLSKLIG